MGTNFYWHCGEMEEVKPQTYTLPSGVEVEYRIQPSIDRDDPQIHIGKRSAAGFYCWDCNETLCAGGKSQIHQSTHGFYDACPKCGKGKTTEGLESSSAGLELGFAPPKAIRPTGVRSCCSFSWAQEPDAVRQICEANLEKPIIRDEYHRTYTGNQFLQMLMANCPVEFTGSIGKWFS